jgi:cysteine desulfurase
MMKAQWANPSSSHAFGVRCKEEIENARRVTANALGAAPEEVYFTSGGTESDNMALFGGAFAGNEKQIVTTSVEHAAVAKTVRNLRREHGYSVDYVPLSGGELDLDYLERAVTEKTAVVSIMLVQNEVGTVFPLAEISRIVKRRNPNALVHCDAVQGFGKIPFTVDGLGVDLLSVSAHKVHGIAGCGALYVRNGVNIFARQFGGGQERGLRSGTESAPLIAAFSEAIRTVFANFEADAEKMTQLRDYAMLRLKACFLDARLNTNERCAPHIVSFTLPGINAGDAVQALGKRGICVSNGSACKSNSRGTEKRKQALEYYGLTDEEVRKTLRLSFCPENTAEEIDSAISALGEIVQA